MFCAKVNSHETHKLQNTSPVKDSLRSDHITLIVIGVLILVVALTLTCFFATHETLGWTSGQWVPADQLFFAVKPYFRFLALSVPAMILGASAAGVGLYLLRK